MFNIGRKNGRKMSKYKISGNMGLFGLQIHKAKLSQTGNPLERFSKAVDFEMFRTELEEKLLNHDRKNNAGAKPCDVLCSG
ncbi:hypothetical protein EZS27_010928 [termite gut metagenome]|uniref:Uncharacterized protein n=2 Tax=termite gut metagenome TaxID=433724 RepID=A0A5J4S652_9ZZZZ